MELTLKIVGKKQLTLQVYDALRDAILSSRISVGERLPSTRELSMSLGVSRNTINNAYERLASEGYVDGRRGSGTYVSDHLPADLQPLGARSQVRIRLAAWGRRLTDPVYTPEHRDLPFDFRPGVCDLTHFPVDVWRRVSSSTLRYAVPTLRYYSETAGYRPLRDAVARYIGKSRAVRCSPDSVVITSGSQQALDLLARVLLQSGDRVVVEDPGYPAAAAVFRAAGARLCPVPVDSQGIRVDLLPRHAKLVYVTPSHQFPLGVPLTLGRRYALLDWAVKNRALILEDDYDSDFRFAGRQLESLHSLDRSGVVVYLGTFSKVLFPGLRLGYVVVPPGLYGPFLAAKRITDRHSAVLDQQAMAEFITQGHFAKYVRKLQRAYAERRETLIQEMERRLAGWITPNESVGGLHLTGMLTDHIDVESLIKQASVYGVGLHSIAPFFLGPKRPGLIFGYGMCEPEQIREAIERIARVLGRM